jgi:hypothetical protein
MIITIISGVSMGEGWDLIPEKYSRSSIIENNHDPEYINGEKVWIYTPRHFDKWGQPMEKEIGGDVWFPAIYSSKKRAFRAVYSGGLVPESWPKEWVSRTKIKPQKRPHTETME